MSQKIKNNQLQDELEYRGDASVATHLHVCAYDEQGVDIAKGYRFADIEPLVNRRRQHWLQVHGLSDVATIEQICRHYEINFLVAQDILNPQHLAKIEQHDHYNVVILKLMLLQTDGSYTLHQISMIQGEDFVLTFSDRDIDFFSSVPDAVQNNVSKVRNRGCDFLLSVLLNSIMSHYMAILSDMEDQLEDLEELLLDTLGDTTTSIGDIQKYRKLCRMIKKYMNPLKDGMHVLLHCENCLVQEATLPFFQDVNDHLKSVFQSLDTCREMISALVDLYLSNNDQRMNSIMKQLTVVSTLFIPLTFFAGVWGMNFRVMPELDWKYGYAGAWGLMVVIALVVFWYFKRKKWY